MRTQICGNCEADEIDPTIDAIVDFFDEFSAASLYGGDFVGRGRRYCVAMDMCAHVSYDVLPSAFLEFLLQALELHIMLLKSNFP